MDNKNEISVIQNSEIVDKLTIDIEAADLQLQLIKKEKEIAKEKRELALENRSRTDDFLSWGLSKTTGVGALFIGGIEFLDPNLLPLVLTNPLALAGGGLGLLVGKDLISRFTKILNALDE